MNSKDTITLQVYAVKAETEKAVKASVNYDTEGGDKCFTSWLPKKHAKISEDKKSVEMSLWLYNKNKY